MAYTGKKPGTVNTDFLEAGGALANHDQITVDASGNITATSYSGSGASLSGLSSENTRITLTIDDAGSATAGRVANIQSDGKTGKYPVTNSVASEATSSVLDEDLFTPNGKYMIKAYTDGSNYHVVETYDTSDWTMTDQETVSTYTSGSTSAPGTSIVWSGYEDQYAVYGIGYYDKTCTARCNNCTSNTQPGYDTTIYFYVTNVKIDRDTGVITYGSDYTYSRDSASCYDSAGNRVRSQYGGVQNVGGGIIALSSYEKQGTAFFGCSNPGGCESTQNYLYWGVSVKNTNNTVSTITNGSGDRGISNGFFAPGYTTKVFKWGGDGNVSSWQVATTNDSAVSSVSTLSSSNVTATFSDSHSDFVDRFNDEASTDALARRLIFFYQDSNGNVKLETYEYDDTEVAPVSSSITTLYENNSSKTLDGVACDHEGGMAIFRENNKVYALSFSLDSSYIVDEVGIPLEVVPRNVNVDIYNTGDNEYTITWEEDSYRRSKVITVNAYSTVAMHPIGVFTESATAGNEVTIATSGVVGGFTGLTPQADYYFDTSASDGTITTSITSQYVGKAISSTEILLGELAGQ